MLTRNRINLIYYIIFYCLLFLFANQLSSSVFAINNNLTNSFEHYKAIIKRNPFGSSVLNNKLETKTSINNIKTNQDSFAKNLRISALIEIEDKGIKVGLIDSKEKKNYLLSIGDIEDDLEVISANYEAQEVVLRKGDETAVLKLSPGDAKTLNNNSTVASANTRQPVTPKIAATVESYLQRRKNRELLKNQQKSNIPQPAIAQVNDSNPNLAPNSNPNMQDNQRRMYTEEELNNRLQNYQTELIQQGLPPMPVLNQR